MTLGIHKRVAILSRANMLLAGKTTLGRRRFSAAFSRIDAIIVCLLLFFLAFRVLQYSFARPHRRSAGVVCANHLKNIGLAFRTFATDNADRYPMQISTNEGGTLEWVSTDQVFRHFQVLSNELNSPRTLICPANRSDAGAATFGRLTNRDLDYFVGVDAAEDRPGSWLAGDRFMTNNAILDGRLLRFGSNTLAGWLPRPHQGFGFVVFGDAHVEQLSSAALGANLRTNPLVPIRVAMP